LGINLEDQVNETPQQNVVRKLEHLCNLVGISDKSFTSTLFHDKKPGNNVTKIMADNLNSRSRSSSNSSGASGLEF
jgi:hypothetical protein